MTSWFNSLRQRWSKRKPPVILHEGQRVGLYRVGTNEWFDTPRQQAAQNMKDHPEVRAEVEALLIKQYGSEEAGLKECKRRFPEAYEK